MIPLGHGGDEILAMDDPDNIPNDENNAIDGGEPDSVHVTKAEEIKEDKVNSRIYYRGAEIEICFLAFVTNQGKNQKLS